MSDPDLDQALRQAEGTKLTRLVLEAPAGALEAALDNPGLSEEHMLLLLRRSDLGGELLRRVSEETRWAGLYLVKAALVSNPHTPKVIALNLAKHLFWRDLAKLLKNYQVGPQVRRMAEVLLRDRVHEVTLGERIALARMAPREVIMALRHDGNDRVLSALLDNPRFIEDDAVAIAANQRSSHGQLNLLARNERWASRPAVRMALIRNPRTPLPTALSIMVSLREPELRAIAQHAEAPPRVRADARRLLQERSRRTALHRS